MTRACRSIFLLALLGCGGAPHASVEPPAAAEPHTTADEDAVDEPAATRRDPGPLAARYTIQTLSIEITTASVSAPVAVGTLCRLNLEYGGTYPRCLANLDCGGLSLYADANYQCELYERDAIGSDTGTTRRDDGPSMIVDTIDGEFAMSDDAEGRLGAFVLQGRVLTVVPSQTPEHWR